MAKIEIEVPDFKGFRATGEFRQPSIGEYFWNVHQEKPTIVTGAWIIATMIYVPIPRRRIIFEETGEVRPPQKGEIYLYKAYEEDSEWTVVERYGDSPTPRSILTRREETF